MRLQVLKLLVRAGPNGLPVNALKKSLDCPGSTLSHHINRLAKVGIIRQLRVGRELRPYINFDALQGLVDFLYEKCCMQSDTHAAQDTPCCPADPKNSL
ncbi:MAG: helix-turn-helix transcriptional regulator [Porticoccaceae bacterium]|nr:helix-turn-helix transcriptional regulator [Porticoccaceae bacterium]